MSESFYIDDCHQPSVTAVEDASWHDSVRDEVLVLRESIIASLWNFGCFLYVLHRLSPDRQSTYLEMIAKLWDTSSPSHRELLMTRESRILLGLIWIPLMLGVSAGAKVLGLVAQRQSESLEAEVGMGKAKTCLIAMATTLCGVAADLTGYFASLGDPIAARMTVLFVTCSSPLTVALQTLFLLASSIPFDSIGAIYLSGSQAPLLPTSSITSDSLDEKDFDVSPHLLVIDVDSMEERLIGT
ncbi:BQ2448_7889 [Microbotryum intermedium]|uniref:BQ2448_7889 protein n=1 Tax=Microbotryum intermedium TaxID=269621 RepID=A0A238FM65_9BASI|nr:BQ2448_7889 [Microbotryum intermedium]